MKKMKLTIVLLWFLLSMVFFTSCEAQLKNAKTETIKIYGNCEMCKKTIETASNKKGVSKVDWNKDTKMAEINFDSKKTNLDAILKQIAYVGYDSDTYLAPDEAYAKLPGCCKYDRIAKQKKFTEVETTVVEVLKDTIVVTETLAVSQFKAVFDSYLDLKNAFVKSDSKTASIKAKELVDALNKVDMTKLTNDQHMVWMKNNELLIDEATKISKAKDIEKQRQLFSKLSLKMHALIKISKLEITVYYQHCPMYNDGKGANWLSTENTIKNPYYGSQMLTCGKTVETIK